MKQLLGAIFLILVSGVGACDVKVKSQVPSHVAEFTMSTHDYPELIAALDAIAVPFGLKRVNAAPGLDELHGRKVLFAAYEAKDPNEWRGALEVNDIYGPERILLRVYGDYFDDAERRAEFVMEVAGILNRFGGTLSESDGAGQP